MSDDDLVECRLCGKPCRSLGNHLRAAHGMGANEYRDLHGIRRGVSLASPTVRAQRSASMKATIAAGKLDAHFATNGTLARRAAAEAARVIATLRDGGADPRRGAPSTPRAVIEAIVVAVEAGELVATAVKRSPIVYSAFHTGLSRHPDLKARVEAAKTRRRGVSRG